MRREDEIAEADSVEAMVVADDDWLDLMAGHFGFLMWRLARISALSAVAVLITPPCYLLALTRRAIRRRARRRRR